MRELFWLTEAEATRLRAGLSVMKRGYEARWESAALFPLAASPILAAQSHGVGFGLALLWVSKFALQGLIHKGFFDPLP